MKDKEQITLKNTKAEILEALNNALKREKELAKIKSDPVKEQQKKREVEVIKETKVDVDNNIFSTELNEKYNNLLFSIDTLEKKLKELYGVENELNNLTLVVNTHKDLVRSLEEKEKIKSVEVNDKLGKLEAEYKEKEEEVKKSYDRLIKNLKLERDREVEEYNYKLKRDREIENNKWSDEKSKRLAEIASKEEETNKLLSNAKENEKKFLELETEVSKIPDLLAKEYEKGRKDAEKELSRDFKYEKDLLVAEYKNTIDRQTDKIESLSLEIDKLNEMNKNLQIKMDKAYSELKDIATRTVEANGGVKILGNNNAEINK